MSYTEQYFMIQIELAKYSFYVAVGLLAFVVIFCGGCMLKLAIEDLINKIKNKR